MIDKINKLQKQALEDIENAKNSDALDAIWQKYLGRKNGKLTTILRSIKDLDQDQRPKIGSVANKLTAEITQDIEKQRKALESVFLKKQDNNIDITLPGKHIELGHLHPLTQMRDTIAQIFMSLGFDILEGNELVSDYYNFESLNIPKGHPARDMWDTFYVYPVRSNMPKASADPIKSGRTSYGVKSESRLLLRTHTSAMQVKVMEERKPPLKVCIIGKCFRHEATDASHEHTLYQVEGFVVDKHISIAHLIYTIKTLIKSLFHAELKLRLRPSYFPFTEPSFEVDIACVNCNTKGCLTCSSSGFMEILGCGMIHPYVFKAAGYVKGAYTGFAFGIGLDRLVMLKHNISDIRLLRSGDLRFIKQF